MSKIPGVTRKYNSTRRKAEAQKTRNTIIEAANKLFVEKGYSGATIEMIAREAGVAPETVYAAFGNKLTILTHLIGIKVGGDDQNIPILQRPGPQNVLHEIDPIHQIQLFSVDITGILERVAPVFGIMNSASKTEPEIDNLLKQIRKERFFNLEKFIQNLAAHGRLQEGMDVTQAAEFVWTLTDPDVFTLLTDDRQWPREKYIQWLSNTLIRLLLA